MQLSASDKHKIIQIVTRSEIGVKRTLSEFGIARSTFYKWYSNYLENGFEGLESKRHSSCRKWNSIPESQKDLIVELALDCPELSGKELPSQFHLNYTLSLHIANDV
ncbi:helix-turn-helix domain-containing protein [Vaginella massiliensis]|uniref:helix-turn-helix domain-containing protein n=1 Tax=Vaginella massiliensis TaxID=1816680 RepID=UPI0012B610ED|nr:helix-turn-helix domain-containing protein [Vaginella massiliensis]